MFVKVAIFMYKKKTIIVKKKITNLKINTTDAFCQWVACLNILDKNQFSWKKKPLALCFLIILIKSTSKKTKYWQSLSVKDCQRYPPENSMSLTLVSKRSIAFCLHRQNDRKFVFPKFNHIWTCVLVFYYYNY